ncbi:STAS domain-containing protein [Candidatus Viridilinea mediisalina]|uniref:Anti-sigma factor antagonist n=1 Tax=Candidatus Viridilinea mediisalina TaxID=2024553 RepID=A0A2A6RHQ0_9CHLR|nr:STAS domain-containing protein [Candidatus Viridilinea mediisalina]PDW02370.1 anti-anti-sigma factor [Candidatus Viridilinea mediisalina]
MEITITPHEPTTAIVYLQGRLNLLVAGELRQRLLQEVAEGRSILVIDMSSVSFIDSSGLGALIGSLKIARLAGGDLRLAAINDQAETLLRLTTLNKLLRPYADVAAALDLG